MRKTFLHLGILAVVCAVTSPARAFVIGQLLKVDADGRLLTIERPGIPAAARWDADPLLFNGEDRSLVGGLTYQIDRTSLLDSLSWASGQKPDLNQLNTLIAEAFALWPVSRSYRDVAFTPLAGTPSISFPSASQNNVRGAEIDIGVLNLVDANTLAGTYKYGFLNDPVTLTSGVHDYGSSTLLAADIAFNTAHTGWTQFYFKYALAHELGHTLGLGDVTSVSPNPDRFADTDGTVNNPIPINPFDPTNSPGLAIYPASITLAQLDPGILMNYAQPKDLSHLSNDDLGGREFLYPAPEPATWGMGLLVLAAAVGVTLRRARAEAKKTGSGRTV